VRVTRVAPPPPPPAAPDSHSGLAAPFSPKATIYRPDCWIKEDPLARWDATGSGRIRDGTPRSSPRAGELIRPKLPRDLIEHGVDHAGLVFVHEGIGDVDIFGNDDTRRHVAAVPEL